MSYLGVCNMISKTNTIKASWIIHSSQIKDVSRWPKNNHHCVFSTGSDFRCCTALFIWNIYV